MAFKSGISAIQWFITHLFFSHPWLLLSQLGFPCPFTFVLKELLTKREFSLGFTKVQTHNHSLSKPMHNHSTNSCIVMI